jgi:uncharacterized protein (DUF4415 family)
VKKRSTIITYDPDDPKAIRRKSLTDWERLRTMDDSEIDFSDIPPLGDDFFKNAVIRMPRAKKMVSIRLDEEVINWYKQEGEGYQTRMNAVLKAFMKSSIAEGLLRVKAPEKSAAKSTRSPKQKPKVTATNR